jgi:cell division protein FtsQ
MTGQIVVDPRMRSRRVAVRRDQGQRRLKRATVALGVVAVLVGAAAATQSPLLDVDRVDVRGARRTGTPDVRQAAAIEPGDTMLGVDAAQAAARIEELPWIDQAAVARHWPGTVEIEVTERRPLAVVGVAEGRGALVDPSGRVLEVTAEPPADLPELTGVRGRIVEGEQLDTNARGAVAVLRAVTERLPGPNDGGLGDVVSVSTELDASLASGGTIRFGTTEELDDKVVAVEAVLADVDTACLAVLDVRVPTSPALTRHQTCS